MREKEGKRIREEKRASRERERKRERSEPKAESPKREVPPQKFESTGFYLSEPPPSSLVSISPAFVVKEHFPRRTKTMFKSFT